MNHIDDERVVFFLKHEKQIREWIGLEREFRAVAQGFLVGCHGDLAALASKLGDDVRLWSNIEGAGLPESRILLHRSNWLDTDGRLCAGIGLGWNPSKVTFAATGRPFTGLYVDIGTDVGKTLHGEIKSRLSLSGVLQGTRYTRGNPWAAYRSEDAPEYEAAPEGEYWLGLQSYRAQLVAAVRGAWELMSSHVDAVVNVNPS